MTGVCQYFGWKASPLSTLIGKIGSHQLSWKYGADYQVSRCGWKATAIPVVR